MRQTFRAYYPLDGQEIDSLWNDGAIVLDTNTLLNFFRYTRNTRDEFLHVLEQLRESLWLPYQVGLEFQRRRLDVISNTGDAFSRVKESVDAAKNTIQKTLNEYKHHPSLNRGELTDRLNDLFITFTTILDTQARAHEEWISGDGDPDKVFIRISDLYVARIGERFSDKDLEDIADDGKKRYENKVPPGYKDAGKSNGNEYGDLIIWKEILQYGAASKRPLIFVTDDAKEDWWRIDRGKTQGGRPELIDEYWEASGQRIHFYEPLQFLKYAKERTQSPVSNESLDEVKEVSSGNERPLRVLQERYDVLVRQQLHMANSGRRRRRADSEGPALLTQLDIIAHEQLRLERERELLISELYVSPRAADSGSAEGLEQFSRSRHEMQAGLAALDERLESLVERRADLERRFRDAGNQEERWENAMERRRRSIENELREVSTAIEELEDK
ncbi:PIN domain-containing protein [Naumannella huperziae]